MKIGATHGKHRVTKTTLNSDNGATLSQTETDAITVGVILNDQARSELINPHSHCTKDSLFAQKEERASLVRSLLCVRPIGLCRAPFPVHHLGEAISSGSNQPRAPYGCTSLRLAEQLSHPSEFLQLTCYFTMEVGR